MLTEDAYADGFQETAIPYITANKAVFITEYTDRMTPSKFTTAVCPDAINNKLSAILKDRDLTSQK